MFPESLEARGLKAWFGGCVSVKTCLIVWFNSEGSPPHEVISRLASLGFEPTTGAYDFVFEWSKKPSLHELLSFADKIHQTLRGLKVSYKIESL
jgi:hypothetical protein